MSAKRGNRITLRSALVMAALLVVGSSAAVAAVDELSATTGVQVPASVSRAVGSGQALAMGAANDVSVGASLTKDIQFAPGYEAWRDKTIAFQTALSPGSPPAGHAFITSGALRWQVAEAAACSWLDYYVSSQETGNSAAATSAAAQIKAAPAWPAITGLNYPSGLGQVVNAVGASDAKLVQALIDTGQAGNCTAVGPFPTAAQRAQVIAAKQAGQSEIASDPTATRLGITAAG